MPIGRPVATIVLSSAEKEKLTLIANRPKSNQRDALRARVILGASEGLSNTEIARRERVCLPTVGKWRSRYARQKIEALADAPRSGAPRSIDDKKVEEVLTKTLETTPRARTHWSSRLMAKEAAISEHSVLRIWRAFGLKPHRVDSFKLSADPMFVEKVRDIVGLYLNPPDKAIVLCVDEKSQTQALERSQPILPLRPGLPERQSHDYVRHGTLSLFAAYDAATGRVLGRCHQRHRHQEFLAFLERIDAGFPDDGKSQLHLIIDNYSTRKHPQSPSLAATSSTLPASFHSDWQFLAQHGRAFLRSDHHRGHSPRKLLFGATTSSRHRCLPRRAQQRTQTFYLDCLCRFYL